MNEFFVDAEKTGEKAVIDIAWEAAIASSDLFDQIQSTKNQLDRLSAISQEQVPGVIIDESVVGGLELEHARATANFDVLTNIVYIATSESNIFLKDDQESYRVADKNQQAEPECLTFAQRIENLKLELQQIEQIGNGKDTIGSITVDGTESEQEQAKKLKTEINVLGFEDLTNSDLLTIEEAQGLIDNIKATIQEIGNIKSGLVDNHDKTLLGRLIEEYGARFGGFNDQIMRISNKEGYKRRLPDANTFAHLWSRMRGVVADRGTDELIPINIYRFKPSDLNKNHAGLTDAEAIFMALGATDYLITNVASRVLSDRLDVLSLQSQKMVEFIDRSMKVGSVSIRHMSNAEKRSYGWLRRIANPSSANISITGNVIAYAPNNIKTLLGFMSKNSQ